MKKQFFVLFQQQPLGKKRIARLTSCASFAFLLVATMTLQRKRCSVSFLSFLEKEMRCFCPIILPKNGHLKSSK
ncbi:hypothetical protein [Prevotella sp. TCVGH]|uniref:hypothetical protein n=1 Tax=Prevotella sp. TCVGH TaxID=2182433 RepID=UPI00201D6912|nr:hypothetical protein [Prevotella sp. TCVGH]